MIHIKRSRDEFEYEVRGLAMAFFHGEKIVTKNECQTLEPDDLLIDMMLDEQKIGISFVKNEIPILMLETKADLQKRPEYKNALKQLLYQGLSKITNKELPWGTLTGVRPTKLALTQLEEGQDKASIKNFFEEQYLCSEEKTKLSLEIASRELDILRKIDYKKGYSIYIGIPFCPTTCLYCSFTSYSIGAYRDYVDSYLSALFQEIDYAKRALSDKKLISIYIGGGTPTTLNEEQLERLLIKVVNSFRMSTVSEFTVEAGRPDSITYEKLRLLKQYGVTRISINPQTMNQKTLDLIGRRHTTAQIEDAFLMARELGHTNINMDLIVGLPGEDVKEVDITLAKMRELKPDNLTVHTLAIKRAAYLNMYKKKYQDLHFGDASEMLLQTRIFAKEQGYVPYYLYRQKNMSDNLENVGYAKPGMECIYNILIMEEKQTILALGAGASSKFVFHDEGRIERVENVKDVKEYIARIDEMIERKKNFVEKVYYGGQEPSTR